MPNERYQREVSNLVATVRKDKRSSAFVAQFLEVVSEYCSSGVTPDGTEEPNSFFSETVLPTLIGPTSNPNSPETVTNALQELSSILASAPSFEEE